MVGRSRLFYTLLLVACLQPTVATAFNAQLSHTQLEMGKSVTLLLQSDRLSPSLRSIELAALRHNFHVLPGAEIKLHDQQQQWHIRLYPLHAGKLAIPSLTFVNHTSPRLSLDVSPARDSQSGHPMSLDHRISTNTSWLNQQVIISLSVTSKDTHVVLETSATELATGKLLPVPMRSTRLPSTKARLTRHSIGWIYFPTQAGRHKLELPAIRYRRDGVDTHHFYLPRQHIMVKPLPIYVPTNFPLGQLSLQAEKLPLFIFSNHLQQLRLTLRTKGLRPQQLPRLQNYLHSQSGLQIYPATSSTAQQLNPDGINTETRLQIPFKANTSGLYHLDDIRLQYFDPQHGKIQTLQYRWPAILILSPWLVASIGLLLLLALIILLRYVVQKGRQRLHRYRTLQQARQTLVHATTPQAIKEALMLISVADGGSANTSLYCWHRDRQINGEPLHKALYAGNDYDIQRLKHPYLALC